MIRQVRRKSDNLEAELHGPYAKASYPYGRAMLTRRDWYLKWSSNCICITQFDDQPNRFVVAQHYPFIEASTLVDIITKILKEFENVSQRNRV